MAPQCGLMHAEKDDTQRNRQALLAGLLAGAVGFVAFLAYRRHHRARAGKAAPRRAGRGDGKAGPPKHETSMTGDGGNGSPASGDAAPAEDSASGAQQPAPKTEDSSARRGDAAACSAGGGAGPQSASKSAVPDAAPHPSSACVSGACAVLNGPAGLASAAGLDVSDRSGREPAAAHAASTTPATQPGHDQRQRWGSDAALTSVPGSRQVIPAVSRSEAPASGGKRTASKLAPSSTGDTQASGAVPVWTQPDAEPQNATPGERSTAPVSTALVRATPASKKAVIVHNPSAEAGRTQLPPPPQQRRNADGMEGRPTTADAAPSESPSENGNKSRSNGTASQQPDSTSLEVGSDGPAESQQGGAHADGDDGGQADGQAAKCSGLPYTWSQDHDDIFLAVPVAADVTAGEVSVGFRARSLRVAIGGEVIVTGELPQPVHPEDCTWQFEEVAGERRLCLTLVKARPELWWSAIRGHPELDQAALKTVAALYAGAKDGAPCHLPLAIEE